MLQTIAFRKEFMGFEVFARDFGSSVRSEGRMVLLWELVVVSHLRAFSVPFLKS